jgi:hypothetical protein
MIIETKGFLKDLNGFSTGIFGEVHRGSAIFKALPFRLIHTPVTPVLFPLWTGVD